MLRFIRHLACVAALGGVSALAHAQEDESQTSFLPGGYWVAEMARVATELNSGGQKYQFSNINVGWGYQFQAHLAAELLASFNVLPEQDRYVSGLLGQRVDAEYSSVGAFLAGRWGSTFYATGRVGLVESRFAYSSKGFEDSNASQFGFAYGFGAGVEHNWWQWEVKYTILPDVDDPIFSAESYSNRMIGLGFNYHY